MRPPHPGSTGQRRRQGERVKDRRRRQGEGSTRLVELHEALELEHAVAEAPRLGPQRAAVRGRARRRRGEQRAERGAQGRGLALGEGGDLFVGGRTGGGGWDR